ncbi:hypothetical protein EVG20_g6594 [Dentipellis fragilis]|uniref:Uncharacterized protein n=1 Tax=Dentipellis fragilis TaxID=205917 RepID=A0A4Y9YNZ9_9AGAM|nr:hypothetical protein EVG20_g6594 [Dentipellis fragilis]
MSSVVLLAFKLSAAPERPQNGNRPHTAHAPALVPRPQSLYVIDPSSTSHHAPPLIAPDNRPFNRVQPNNRRRQV